MLDQDLITSAEAAEICGVSQVRFTSTRKGINAPDPVHSKRIRNKETGKLTKTEVFYSKAEYIKWAENNNFWELACEYHRIRRFGSTPRKQKIAHRQTADDKLPKVDERYKQVKLNDPLKNFLLGRYAPEPVKTAHAMKMIRARLNKRTTIKVKYNGENWNDLT